jgi:hypothetical protein
VFACAKALHLDYSINVNFLERKNAKNIPLWRKEIWIK